MAETTTETQSKSTQLARIREEVLRRERFLITSHARPDGDSIGSQLALTYALRALGKHVTVVNRDEPPPNYLAFPGVSEIQLAGQVDGTYDALFVMECSDISRPGVAGLERYFLINVDHHLGNTMYGAVNWFDETASACGEMVSDIIDALAVPFSREIATHLYLAILTDTGSFRHSNITARTFEICRRAAEAGVIPAEMARIVFDTTSLGRLKLIGQLLQTMELADNGRVAVLSLDERSLSSLGCTPHDTDGLINLPLSAQDVRAVVFFKIQANGREIRVSLRSKDEVDVRAVALEHGGGGHRNASGFTSEEPLETLRPRVVEELKAVMR